MKNALAVLTAMTVLVLVASGQPPGGPPKPGPEHKLLDHFAGTWHFVGEMKPTPVSPAGKFEITQHNEWFPGGFFLVSRAEGKSPMGEEKSMTTFGYDRQEKSYSLYGINSVGMATSAKGTLDGDTWTWTTDKMFGFPMKGRVIIRELSATSMTLKLETSSDGSTWETLIEGKGTKKE